MNGPRLSKHDHDGQVRPVVDSLFCDVDSLTSPVQPWVPGRSVIYPYGYSLDDDEFIAVADMARAAGDQGFYLSYLEHPEAAEGESYTWLIPLDEPEAYDPLVRGWRNVLISPSGKWAILGSSSHAVVAGEEDFVQQLIRGMGLNERETAISFMRDSLDEERSVGSDISWVAPLLKHVYGDAEAAALISAAHAPGGGANTPNTP